MSARRTAIDRRNEVTLPDLPEPTSVSLEEWRRATKVGRFQVTGSRVRGEATPDSDWDFVAMLTREESWRFRSTGATGLPDDLLAQWDGIRMAFRGKGNKPDIFVVVYREDGGTTMYGLSGTSRHPKVTPAHTNDASIAGGWPRGEYPRPLYFAVTDSSGRHFVARRESPRDQPGTPVEFFAAIEDAEARMHELDAAESGPIIVGHPEWRPELAAEFGHHYALSQHAATLTDPGTL